jgi:hypothetical protein
MTLKQFDSQNPNKFAVDETGKFVEELKTIGDKPQTQPGPHLSSTSQKLAAKHAADRAASEAADLGPLLPVAGGSLEGAEPTPDGLGAWEGGNGKGAPNWVSLKSHATSFGDRKNEHGNNPHLGPKPTTHRQDQDFNEIHTDANGDLFLYNVETDKWDIKTDAQTIPFYEDEEGNVFAFNYQTGAWDVPVVAEDQDATEAVSLGTVETNDESKTA